MKLNKNDVPEFVGQVIDIFEDFLEDKGIWIENDEREESHEGAAILYGSDYGTLQTALEGMFKNWGLVEEESQ